jgi:hypothetical protein
MGGCRFYANRRSDREEGWCENELRIFIWVLLAYLHVHQKALSALVRPSPRSSNTTGSTSPPSSTARLPSSSSSRPAASSVPPSVRPAGCQKKPPSSQKSCSNHTDTQIATP